MTIEPGMIDNDQKKASHSNRVDMAGNKSTQTPATLMKTLLADQNVSIGDKIATVKTAHHVDKGRFKTAFKTLMEK